MVTHIVASTASRGLRQAASTAQRRHMGSGGPKPEWTGIDKVVRGYFPEDYQLAGAILSGYGALISLAVLRSKLKGEAPPEPVTKVESTAPVATAGDVLPATDSPDFETFIGGDSFGKFLESEESMMKWVDGLSKE